MFAAARMRTVYSMRQLQNVIYEQFISGWYFHLMFYANELFILFQIVFD